MKVLSALLASMLVAFGGFRACAGNDPGHVAQARPAISSKVGEIGRFTLVNDASRELAPRIMSFGQVFRPGEIGPGAALEVAVGGVRTPAQMDAKAFNPDGSVRHAVLTIEAPRLGGRNRAEAVILSAGDAAPPKAEPPSATPDLKVVVQLKAEGGAQARTVTLDLPSIAKAETGGAPWLQGPLATERRYAADVDDRLQVLFDVFTPVRGPARVEVAFHNDWTGTRYENVRAYDVELRLADKPIQRYEDVYHYPFANWRKVVWTDGQEPARVVPELATLQAAAAIPRYFPDARIDPGLVRAVRDGARAYDEPLSSAMITKNMPNTGGRMDIGPLPTWAVIDLLQGDAATRRALLANGDAAGSVPWHIRDRKTGRPLTLDDHPGLWLDPRGQDAAKDVLPDGFDLEAEDWRIDDAHQPSLTYLPYLLTGSQYYRDELAQQAAFVLLFYDPGFRGREKGLFIGDEGQAWQQVRGVAWSLRTLATAAYALPADDPMQPYFDRKLRANLAKLVELYVKDRELKSAGEIEGWVPGAYSPEHMTAPWQQGFLAVVLNWTNDMGYADAGRMAGWMSNFLSGLFTNADKGFDPNRGAAYRLPVYNDDGERISTWTALYAASELPDKDSSEVEETWRDYARIMRAGVGAGWSATGSANAARALEVIDAKMRRSGAGPDDPTFAIAPTRPLPAKN